MSMPTSAEVARWREDLETASLPDTAYILSVSRSSDSQGGWIDTWGTVTSAACRLDAYASKGISSFNGNEMLAGGAVQAFGRWVLTLPHGTDVAVSNRVEVGTRTLNVIAVDSGKSWSAEVRCIVEQV